MNEIVYHIALAKLCGWFGITRQEYSQEGWKEVAVNIKSEVLMKEVLNIRKKHKRIGTRKLYEMHTPVMNEHQIKIGRDKLFDLHASQHMLILRRRSNIRTTFSNH